MSCSTIVVVVILSTFSVVVVGAEVVVIISMDVQAKSIQLKLVDGDIGQDSIQSWLQLS